MIAMDAVIKLFTIDWEMRRIWSSPEVSYDWSEPENCESQCSTVRFHCSRVR
jgi:hypothetical protein